MRTEGEETIKSPHQARLLPYPPPDPQRTRASMEIYGVETGILSNFHPLAPCMSLLVDCTEMDEKMTVGSNFPRQLHQWTPQTSKRGLIQWGTLISSILRWIPLRISSSLSLLLHQSTFLPQTSLSPAYLSKKVCLGTTYSFNHNESATPQISLVRASTPRQTLGIPSTVRSNCSCSCAGGRRSRCPADQRSPGQRWRPSRDIELGTQSAILGELLTYHRQRIECVLELHGVIKWPLFH